MVNIMLRQNCHFLHALVRCMFVCCLYFIANSTFYSAVAGEKGDQNIFQTPQELTASEEAEIDKMVLPLPKDWTGDFDAMRQKRLIRILVPNSKTFYWVDRGSQEGLDYDYGTALHGYIKKKYPEKDKSKELRVVFIPVRRDQLLPGLIAGKGDIAAGGLTVTADREKLVDFSAPFAKGVREALVTGPDYKAVTKIEDLSGKEITVRASSSYYEHLTAINVQLHQLGLAPVKILEADEWLESEDLLEMVNANLIQATVVDRYLAQIWQPLFTELQIHDEYYIAEGENLAWAIRKDSPQLAKMLANFMNEHKVGTTFGNILVNRYVKDSKRVLNATAEKEIEKFRQTIGLFRQHSATYGFDYLMLMAQAYQESTLDQNARSHMGAVGIMQMLPKTAADPNVNIQGIDKDVSKNIEAGAKYLRFLTDRYLQEKELTTVNQTLLAFAAYNAGPGNLRKFRRLAEKSGNDPNVWFQNVEYAAARIVGQETVKYVANIYKYYLAYKLAGVMEDEVISQ